MKKILYSIHTTKNIKDEYGIYLTTLLSSIKLYKKEDFKKLPKFLLDKILLDENSHEIGPFKSQEQMIDFLKHFTLYHKFIIFNLLDVDQYNKIIETYSQRSEILQQINATGQNFSMKDFHKKRTIIRNFFT